MGLMAPGGGVDVKSLPTTTDALTQAGLDATRADRIANAYKAIDKAQAVIDEMSGKSDGMKEPLQQLPGGAAPASVKTVTELLPERQALSLETAKYAADAAWLIALLTPLLLILQGVWQFLAGGGLQQLMASLDHLIQSAGADAQCFADSKAAMETGLAAVGATLADLNDPAKLQTLATTVTIGPVGCVSDKELPLGEFLDRLMTKLPAVGVPVRPEDRDVPAIEEKTVTETIELAPGVTIQAQSTSRTINPLIRRQTDLVPVNSPAPPVVNLVNTHQFRADPDPFKTLGNPAAALANDLALAADLNDVAGAHANLGSAMGDVADAATSHRNGEAAASLRLSVRALLKALVTYNFQTGADATLASSTPHSLRWWARYEPPPQVLDPAIIEKIAAGTELTSEEITAYDDAVATMATQADSVAAAERRFGALPGTMVYAALGDDPYPDDLDALLPEIPDRIAQREGVDGSGRAQIQAIIFDPDQPDSRVTEIPEILLGLDPRIQANRAAVQRWAAMLQYCRDLPASDVAVLQAKELQTGTLPLLFLQQARATGIAYDQLYTDWLHDRLGYVDKQVVIALATAWDQLVAAGTHVDENSQDPPVVVFLTELLAPVPLRPGNAPMVTLLDELDDASFSIGSMLGTDLAQLVGVAGALLRIMLLLEGTLAETEKAERCKELFNLGDQMAEPVATFPSPGILARIGSAL